MNPIIYQTDLLFSLIPDTILHFESIPTGIHRLAVCFEGTCRIVRSEIGQLCPVVNKYSRFGAKDLNYGIKS